MSIFKATMMMLLLVLTTSLYAKSLQPVDITVTTPDGERHALVVMDKVNANLQPLVLLLHGHLGSAAQALGMKRLSPSPLADWVQIVERDHVIVAALDGLRGSDGQQGWHDCRGDADNNPHSDDVAYAHAVVSYLIKQAHADPARVYVMGMSNGGMMAYRLGLQLPQIAAFAAVSASMAATSSCPEAPTAQIAALMISGDADPLVPYQGGQIRFGQGAPRGGVIAIPEAFRQWSIAHHHALANAAQKILPAQFKDDGTTAQATFYGSSLAESDVALVRIVGGGHIEPSLQYRYRSLYLRLVGAQSSAFESAELAWSFFKNKTQPKASW